LEHTNKLEVEVAGLGEAAVGRTVAEEALASALKTNTTLLKGLKRTKERVSAGQARLKDIHKEDVKKRDAQHKREKHTLEVQVHKTEAKVEALTAQVIALQKELQQAKAVRVQHESPVVGL
jgi:hypothetical protein